MHAHKIEILVIDLGCHGAEEIKRIIENNRWLSVSVESIVTKDIGEWHDDHPLNKCGTAARAYQDIFGESK